MGSGRTGIDWGFHLERHAQSGLSIAEYCRREEVSAWSFYAQRKRRGSRRRALLPAVGAPALRGAQGSGDISFLSLGSISRPAVSVRFSDATVLEFGTALSAQQIAVLVASLKSPVQSRSGRC